MSKDKLKTLSDATVNAVIKLAWHDYTTFEQIEERFTLSEAEVIKLMQRELKPSSFRMWRKRVNGKLSKHQKLSRSKPKSAELSNSNHSFEVDLNQSEQELENLNEQFDY
jgi:uncharacterized protein (TIGR03643 family)